MTRTLPWLRFSQSQGCISGTRAGIVQQRCELMIKRIIESTTSLRVSSHCALVTHHIVAAMSSSEEDSPEEDELQVAWVLAVSGDGQPVLPVSGSSD